MGNFINVPFPKVIPSIIGSAKATTPPTETPNQGGTTLIIPVPVLTLEGDIMIATAGWERTASGTVTPPSGWTDRVALNDNHSIYTRTASGSEPADYTWTTSGSAGQSRGGCIITLRNCREIPLAISDVILSTDIGVTTIDIEDVTNTKCGSIYLGFGTALTQSATEDLNATSPMIEQIEHHGDGSDVYSPAMETIIATILNVTVDVITGNTFTVDGGAPGLIQTGSVALVMERSCP